MSIRIEPDKDQPSVAIEIPIENPLPDYDLEQVEQPTPRDIDGLLVSQGFRDLVDDARGVLTELMCNPPPLPNNTHLVDLGLSHVPDFEIAQLTGAICPGDDEVYRPGLWIVLRSGDGARANCRARAGQTPGDSITTRCVFCFELR